MVEKSYIIIFSITCAHPRLFLLKFYNLYFHSFIASVVNLIFGWTKNLTQSLSGNKVCSVDPFNNNSLQWKKLVMVYQSWAFTLEEFEKSPRAMHDKVTLRTQSRFSKLSSYFVNLKKWITLLLPSCKHVPYNHMIHFSSFLII